MFNIVGCLLLKFTLIYLSLHSVSSQSQTDPNNCKSLGLTNCMLCETTYYQGKNTCHLCKDNFTINYNFSECVFNLNDCAQLDYENNCVQCKCSKVLVQYINDSGVEQKLMRQCISISTPTLSHGCAVYQVSITPPQQYVCVYPHIDYTLKKNTQPYTIEPHNGTYCAEMSADGITCTKCHPGYQNIKGQNICYKGNKVIYNKTQAYFDSNEQKIKPVDKTWHSDENGVIPPITYCLFYSQITQDGPGTCESCQVGYIPTKDKKKCLSFNDPLCVYGQEDSNGQVTCSVCKSPQLYYVDKTSGNCIMRQLFKNLNCKTLNPYNDQCMVCIDKTQSNTYTLLDGMCFDSESTDLANLRAAKCEYQSEKDKCQFCKDNFILADKYKQCVNKIDKCLEAIDEYNCKKCDNLYYLLTDANGYQRCEMNNTSDNCAYSDGIIDSCQQCSNLYYKKKNSSNLDFCSKITNVQNCQGSNGLTDECAKCNSLFFLDPSKVCKPTTKTNCIQTGGLVDECTFCEQAYKVNSTTKACEADATNGQYCTAYNGDICTACKTNLVIYPANTKFCIEMSECATYSSSQCTTCKNSSFLDENKQCILKTIPNCSIQLNKTQCDTCYDTYYLSSDKSSCIPLSSYLNCQKGDGKLNKCTQCNGASYYKLPSLKCGFRTGCTQIDPNNGNCTQCGAVPNYFLENTFCKVLNCQTRNNLNSSDCDKCNSGYDLSSSICKKIQNCAESNGQNSNCTKCDNLYYLKSSQCSTISSINNCLESNGINDNCTKCLPGYYSSSDTNPQCEKQKLNCLEVNSTNKFCSKCKSGYYPLSQDPGECIDISIEKPNCVSTNGLDSLCTKCNNKYYLDNSNNCVQNTIINCDSTDGVGSDCVKCNNLYYINRSLPKCKQVNLNQCQVSDGVYQTCSKCGQSFLEKEKEPEPNQADQFPKPYITCLTKLQITNLIEGCRRYIDTGTLESCILCEDAYYLVKNVDNTYGCKLRAFISIQQCSIYSNAIGSQSDSNNKDICDTCNNGQIPKDAVCISIPGDKLVPFCKVYKRNSELCESCLQDNSGIQKYYLDNNVCIDISANHCKIYKNKLCTLCADNYELTSNGQCILITIQNCKVTVNNLQVECQECFNQYYLAPNKLSCLQHDAISNPKCILFSQTTQNLCLKCDNLYYLKTNGICSELTFSNCETNTLNANTCEKCKDNYILTGSKSNCLEDKTNSSCLQISQETLENPSCINCKMGYSKQTKKLQCANNINMFAHCVEIDVNQLCIKCESGYYLNSQSQCLSMSNACYLIGCGTYSAKSFYDDYYCEQCDTTKYFYNRGDGKCLYNSTPNTTPDKGDGTFVGDGDPAKIPNQTDDKSSSGKYNLYKILLVCILIFI